VSDALLGVLIGGGIGFAGSYVVARVSNRAENVRVDRQLTHERTMREREELRTVIDGAIQTVQDGIYRAGEMVAALQLAGRDQLAAEKVYEPARDEVRQLVRRLNGYQARLAIRLGAGNELAEAVKNSREKMGVFRMLAPRIDAVFADADLEELTGILDEASDLAEQFEEKAVAYAGSELRTDEPQEAISQWSISLERLGLPPKT
jgi:hypothetical protein